MIRPSKPVGSHDKCPLAMTILFPLLLSFVLPISAQEYRWKELNKRVDTLLQEGRYGQAVPLAEEALRIAEKTFGPEDSNLGEALYKLAELYHTQGKYAEAELLYQRSLRIVEKALGPKHPNVAAVLNNLALLYDAQGKYGEAEPLYQRSLRIYEKALGPKHPTVAYTLENLASLYVSQGKYGEAEPLLQRGLRIDEKALGPDHPDVAKSLDNLGVLYLMQGRYTEAEPLLHRALQIDEKALGAQHPNVATLLGSLAELYRKQGKYAEAEPLCRRSLAIKERLGAEDLTVADALNNLAGLYREQGKYAEAEPLYRRSLAIREKVLGAQDPVVGAAQANLAQLFQAERQPEQAQPLFARYFDNLFRQFQYHFSYMSEKERLVFLHTVASSFPGYFSFVLQFRERNPQLVGRMYDLVLWQKGFIVSSVAALRRQIEASGDSDALRLLEQLTAKRTQIATLLRARPSDREPWRKNMEQLSVEANELERALVRRSTTFAQQKKLERVTWQQVRDGLKPSEAAIEFVRFPFHDGRNFTDITYYVALVVTQETTSAPTLVLLGDAKRLEADPLTDYRTRIRESALEPSPGRTTMFEAFWKPLEPALGTASRLYVSTDGVLNQLSLGIVPGNDGILLMEKYELRIVSSTKDILREPSAVESTSAVLIGNPDFDLQEDKQRAALKKLSVTAAGKGQPVLLAQADLAPSQGLRSRDSSRKALVALPGTAAEVRAVDSLLQARKWQTLSLAGAFALEEAVKRVQHPRLLHLATHGFFLQEQKIKYETPSDQGAPPDLEDPMLRSGLYFAGANRALRGSPSSSGLDDGVLTAFEATGLDLQGTELVVLSACQTGLGENQNGEGVFGLRRALQVAGAESVMMSMWSVPDQETRELMTLFYDQWLSGKDKPAALRSAQLQERAVVKERYGQDLPSYWGAWVLVGR